MCILSDFSESPSSSSSSSEEEVVAKHRAKRAKLAADAWASFANNEIARTEERSHYGSAEADKQGDGSTSRHSRQDRGAPLMPTR
jgi:hypothetical protein